MPALGAHVAGGSPLALRVALASAAIALTVAACNAYNDLRDTAEDGRNAPWRPLASGDLSARTARGFVAAASIAALLLAAPLGAPALAYVGALLLPGLAYSRWLKSTVLVGNALVGLLSGLTVPFGALVAGGPLESSLLAGAIVASHVFFREILKTAADETGDAAAGVRTIATAFGLGPTLAAARAAALLFVCVGLLPVALGASALYGAAIVTGVVMPTLAVLARLRGPDAPAHLAWSLAVTKALWFLALPPLALLRP